MRKLFLPLSLLACLYTAGWTQTPDLRQRYESAIAYMPSQLNDHLFNLQMEAHWFPDNSGCWFIHQSPGNKEYLKISLPSVQKTPLFDHAKLAQSLSSLTGKEVKATDLTIRSIEYRSPNELLLQVEGNRYLYQTDSQTLTKEERRNRYQPGQSTSPDSQWVAFSKDYNIYLRSTASGEEKQLSTKGEKGFEYGSWYGWGDIMEGENPERPEHFRVNWSPEGDWLHASICDLRTANKMYLLDWSVDTLYRPRLLSYYRGSPGDTGMVYDIPTFFNVKTGKEMRPDIPRPTHINGVSVRWAKEPGLVYLMYASRGYKNQYIQSYDLNTGQLKLLYHESSETNIDNFWTYFDRERSVMYFLSEKSGWQQLYLLDLATGSEKALTQGDFYIHEVFPPQEADDPIYLVAAGREAGANPYHRYLYRLAPTGSGLTLLSPEKANHEISLSEDRKYFVDNISTIEQPTRTVLRRTQDGKILATLGEAKYTDLKGWTAPETFTAIAKDGKTTIYGAIWRPTYFDPKEKYPVIDATYTGPHTQMYPRSFRTAFANQTLAELGFVVIRVDGLGSSGRSKAFHNYSYKNLGGNLKDHVLAICQLGEKYSWVDTARVGIFGHSAGGYDAAHALLAFPDFYKVGVASSADHDHRMEKAWWPEMYMGWPVDEAYEEQSNITMAGNLKGKLLITHGGIDENVNPSATFKLAEALVQANKQFDMLIFPSQHHGYQGQTWKYFTKVRWNYFIKHLRQEEPIWEIEVP